MLCVARSIIFLHQQIIFVSNQLTEHRFSMIFCYILQLLNVYNFTTTQFTFKLRLSLQSGSCIGLLDNLKHKSILYGNVIRARATVINIELSPEQIVS